MQEEDRAWPRYELVDGELLVTPSPTWDHQEAVMQLLLRLAGYLEQEPVGRVVLSPADIELEPETVLQPDVFVVPSQDVRPRGGWRDIRGLLLAVEILSPSSARHDRVVKRRFFQRMGVPEYWIVDPYAHVVERWRPDDERAELLERRIEWHPVGAAEPLMIDLDTFFMQVHRES